MKKWMAMLLALTVTLSLCACAPSTAYGKLPDSTDDTSIGDNSEQTDRENGEETQEESQETTQDSDNKPVPTLGDTTAPETEPETDSELRSDVPAQRYSNDGGTSIDVLREEIAQSGAVFGVGYVGYFEYYEELGIDFGQWYDSAVSPFATYYPFFSEIDAAHTVGESGYLYCILGRNYEDTVTVTDQGGQTLYSASNGDPILLFCDPSGDGKTTDLTVTVTATDGTVYTYAPTLDELDYPQLLVGDERQLLSWIIQPAEESTVSFDALLAEGWLGINEYGIAGDDVLNPQNWHVSIWDEEKQKTVDFSLSFCPNPPDSGAADGEVLMQCVYENESIAQGEWQGWWRIESELDQPSTLQLDLMLMDGADKAHYESAATISETYWAMIHPNGEILLLIPQSGYSALPFMGTGVSGVELSLALG